MYSGYGERGLTMDTMFRTCDWEKYFSTDLAIPDDMPTGKYAEFDPAILRRLKTVKKIVEVDPEVILANRLTERDVPERLSDAYLGQLMDSTRRAAIQLKTSERKICCDAGIEESDDEEIVLEKLRKHLRLIPGAKFEEIELAFRRKVAKDLGVPGIWTYAQLNQILQQKQFLRNMGMTLDASKEQQLKQVEVVSRFGQRYV
jgi:hypothetical protein